MAHPILQVNLHAIYLIFVVYFRSISTWNIFSFFTCLSTFWPCFVWFFFDQYSVCVRINCVYSVFIFHSQCKHESWFQLWREEKGVRRTPDSSRSFGEKFLSLIFAQFSTLLFSFYSDFFFFHLATRLRACRWPNVLYDDFFVDFIWTSPLDTICRLCVCVCVCWIS